MNKGYYSTHIGRGNWNEFCKLGITSVCINQNSLFSERMFSFRMIGSWVTNHSLMRRHFYTGLHCPVWLNSISMTLINFKKLTQLYSISVCFSLMIGFHLTVSTANGINKSGPLAFLQLRSWNAELFHFIEYQ